MRQTNFILRLLAVSVGALFIYAGALKAWDPVRFASDIENYHLIPWSMSVRMAFYLPWLEMFCGAALVFRRIERGATAILSALMIVFIGASLIAKARGLDVTCGCFGAASNQLSFAWHMLLDFAILALLVILGLRNRREAL